MKFSFKILLFLLIVSACSPQENYDVIIRNGIIYDGSGSEAFIGDVAIKNDTIAAIGSLINAKGKLEIDAKGKAVSPGFINVQSWANETLIEDGRSQSDIRQGVTLEIFGEGLSAGPLNETMKEEIIEKQGDINYPIEWNTLGEYLEFLEKKGVSPNIASYVGATTVRINVLKYEDRKPNAEELSAMKALVGQAMEEGAIGMSTALIYTPGSFADTDELIELCKEVAKYDGVYISHVRSEGDQFLEALDEFIEITEKANIRSQIYHLKAAGTENWYKMDLAIDKIDSARTAGLMITANMYNYTAAGTSLYATMPQWVQEGGHDAWVERLKKPEIRKEVVQEMNAPGIGWENFLYMVGSSDNIIIVGLKNDSLKYLTGKTLTEISELWNMPPAETIIDLVIRDNNPVSAVYFLMTEENVKKQIVLPWMNFGSDAESLAPEGNFLKTNPHPRAYGNFSRLLGKYVREEKLITMEEAILRLTSHPAKVMKIKNRGLLKIGYFADVVVFDTEKISDHATFANPHQYSSGVEQVFVNGKQVLKDGEHTGALPGRFVKGPGWKGSSSE